MAEIFTDGTLADFGTDQGTVQEPAVPDTTIVPTATPVPVQDQQDTVANEADTAGDSSDPAEQEPDQGMEEVQDTDTVNYETYLEQLIQQNELLQTLIKEDQKLDRDMKNIQNAMPAVMCMLGVIIGVLLLHILASYIRP